MTYFTSGAVYHDPEPWAYSRTSKSGDLLFGTPERAATRYDRAMMHYPRPEFDHHNPVLEYFRADVRFGNVPHGTYLVWLNGVRVGMKFTTPGVATTQEHIDHARRVLTKLEGLSK